MNFDQSIQKAEIMLDVLLNNAERSDVTVRELMDEIFLRWKELQ